MQQVNHGIGAVLRALPAGGFSSHGRPDSRPEGVQCLAGHGLEDETPQGDVFQRQVVGPGQMRPGVGQPLGAGVDRLYNFLLPSFDRSASCLLDWARRMADETGVKGKRKYRPESGGCRLS